MTLASRVGLAAAAVAVEAADGEGRLGRGMLRTFFLMPLRPMPEMRVVRPGSIRGRASARPTASKL